MTALADLPAWPGALPMLATAERSRYDRDLITALRARLELAVDTLADIQPQVDGRFTRGEIAAVIAACREPAK